MADHCQSLPASLWEETYKLHPWYILIKDDVPRVDSRSVFPKCAEKGELYYYDASSQTSTKSYREKESKSKKVIMTAVCSPRVQVEWSPHIFASLNDKEKELLEAIPSTKQRYVTYNDQKDYLSFGAQLQINDRVQLCAGALRVPTTNDVHGKLKYIGPLEGQKGTMFGIHLSTNHGDCSGKRHFKCDPMHGIFLPINKLVPVRRLVKATQQETKKRVKHCLPTELGTEDVPQPTMLKIAVTVEIKTALTDSPHKKTWVKGTIVNIVVFEGNTLFAVELKGFQKPTVNTNGFYKGKSVCKPEKPNSTVIVEQSAIRQIDSSLTSGETPSKAKGKSARKSEDQEDENNIMLPASSNMVKILPSSMNMNEHLFVTISRLKDGTSWPSDNHQRDGKPPDGSKGFMSNFRSMWKSTEPPPYPFSVYEVQAIVADSKLCHGLISALELTDKWRASREQKDFFKLESVLQSWWKDIHTGHHTHLQCFLFFLGQYGREDIRDHIEKVPDRGCFDETVLNTVILSVTSSWKLFAAELGVQQREFTGKLKQDLDPYDCLRTVFDIWYRNEKGCNKLGQLLKACHAIGRDTLADEIEQGLNESVLRRISRKIETKDLKLLGEKLLISKVRQDAFMEKFKSHPESVYQMLSYWSMLQSFDANKIEMLASVLYDIDLGHVAEEELFKGLRQHELESTAALLSDNWQKLAPVLVKTQDIEYIKEQKGVSSENCFRMLNIWRGRQIRAGDSNLKEILFNGMSQCDLYKEARQLYYGLDPYTVMELSPKLLFDWTLLASYFGYNKGEIAERMKRLNQAEMAQKMLNEWLHANKDEDPKKTKEKLLDGFVTIRREDLVEWLQNRDDGVKQIVRQGPPPYPFSDFHIEVITYDKKLCQGLIRGLQLESKWKAEEGREAFFRLEYVLQHWWTQIYEERKMQMQEFKILLVQYGREDLRDHIDKVPDCGMFDDTILNTAIFLAHKHWRKFASKLGVKQNDIDEKLKQDVLPEESLRIVFHIWYKQEQGCSKLSKLVKACRSIGQHTLAEEIEQGLSEVLLRKIAHQIELTSWQRLADHLLISPVRQDAFREKFKSLPNRVYHMLSYWSMIQPFGTDKVDGLVSALYDVKLGYVAQTLLYRGLTKHDLDRTAALLSDNWRKLASVLVRSQDIDYIMGQMGDSCQNCCRMLNIWRSRQIRADDDNLKETLFQAICDCDLYREARQLYYGLDPYTLTELSVKLLFDWPLLASYFGYKKVEIAERMRSFNQAAMALKMLNEWLNANNDEDPRKTKEKLLEGFVTIRREDLVEWLLNRDDATPESKRLTRMNMQKVAEKLHLNQQQLMDMLTLNHDDLKRYKTDSVKEDNLLAVIDAWKKKHSQQYGELEAFEKLKNLLEMYEHREALAELSDGSATDPPEVTNRSEGAVGGVPPEEPPFSDLTLDSLVEVNYGEQTLSGVIAWIGDIKEIDGHGILAGVKLDNYLHVGGTDGTFNGTRCFNCHYGRGLVLPLSRCKPDSRFLTETESFTKKEKLAKDDFGGKDCEPVEGYIDPPKNVELYQVGMFKGIQGVHKSCYMDVTLFSMFAYNSVFDAILFHDESTKDDIKQIKNVLRRTIVNPLRSIGYVRADYVLHFRDLLSCLSSMKGLRKEEKDPEEFIHALLQELLNAKPFLQISQGQNDTMESFVYQIFLDKQDNLDTSTVSDLLHLSFLQSDLKLAKVPECLIIQLPRYGKKYKLYDWIIPSPEMDINALIRDRPRKCSDCGKLAFVECKDCTPEATDEGRDVIQSFCRDCYLAKHKRKKHKVTNLSVPLEVTKMFQDIAENVDEDDIAEKTQHLYPEHIMELFSVVCIEASHYVAFVKTGSGYGEQWVFFDSMANRQGGQHGYNIPEVAHLKNFRQQMESDSLRRDMKRHDFSKYFKKLLSDAYICFYRPVKNRTSSNMDTNSHTTHVRSAQGNGGHYSESNPSILQSHHSLGHTESPYQNTFNQVPTNQQVPQKGSSNQRIEPAERRVMSQGFGDRALSSGQQYDNRLYDQVANISADKGTHQNTRYEDEIISQTTHVRSAQGNGGHYSESNQSILQPPHSLGHTDSTYQNTFNQEPTSQQVPQKRNSNQRIEPEERRVMSQGFGDRALSSGQQYDNRLYVQVANISTDKGTHQNTRSADEITDENRMDWESSENRQKCNSSQQSGDPRNYSNDQHIGQNIVHLKDHDIDQQSRLYKSNQSIGQLDKCNSDRHSSHLSLDTSYTSVNQLGSRSDNIRSQGVSTKHENENLKGQRSNNDMETSQQQTSTYPTSTYPPNLPARYKHRNEQQGNRWTHQTIPGGSFTSNQDSPGSSTNYRKTAPSHSQRDGLEVNMTQNITPQCYRMSPHASLNRDQAGSSKGKSLITPDEITSKTSQGNQSKGEMTKNSKDDRSGGSHYSELRSDSSVCDDMDITSYHLVHLEETSFAHSSDV